MWGVLGTSNWKDTLEYTKVKSLCLSWVSSRRTEGADWEEEGSGHLCLDPDLNKQTRMD